MRTWTHSALAAMLVSLPAFPARAKTQAAVLSGDETVWAALAKTAKRVDVGQRLELLSGLPCGRNLKNKVQLLCRLKSLLDDKEIRNQRSSELFEGPAAAFLFKHIAVRDYAADQFAQVLGLPSSVPTWEEPDFAALRKRVLAKLKELEKPQTKEKK